MRLLPISSRQGPRLSFLGLLLPLSLAVIGGCGGEDAAVGLPDDDGTGVTPGDANGAGAGGHGGAGGSGNTGGAGGGDIDAGLDGAIDDAGDVDPDAPIEYPVSDTACERDVAFRANSVVFIPPTAPAFAREVGAFLADFDSGLDENNRQPPFILAVRGSKGADADGAISVAEGNYEFSSHVPKPTPAKVSLLQGRFDSEEQAKGVLSVMHDQGTVDINLVNLRFSAFTQSDCQQVVATVDATLPAGEGGKAIWSGSDRLSLGELAEMGDKPDNYQNVSLRFVLIGDATSFDFTSF